MVGRPQDGHDNSCSCWIDEFSTTSQHARRLGRMALAADDPWDVVVSHPTPR
jgi:acyl-CoA dehydrogenase